MEWKWQMNHGKAPAGVGRAAERRGDGGTQADLSTEAMQAGFHRRPLPAPCSGTGGGCWQWEVLTADLGAQFVLPDGMQLLILLLCKLQALLLHLVDLLLSTQGLLGHH